MYHFGDKPFPIIMDIKKTCVYSGSCTREYVTLAMYTAIDACFQGLRTRGIAM